MKHPEVHGCVGVWVCGWVPQGVVCGVVLNQLPTGATGGGCHRKWCVGGCHKGVGAAGGAERTVAARP